MWVKFFYLHIIPWFSAQEYDGEKNFRTRVSPMLFSTTEKRYEQVDNNRFCTIYFARRRRHESRRTWQYLYSSHERLLTGENEQWLVERSFSEGGLPRCILHTFNNTQRNYVAAFFTNKFSFMFQSKVTMSNKVLTDVACTQTLFYFSFRSFRKYRRACKRSERARTLDDRFEEKIEGMWTGYHWRAKNC